MVGMPLKDKPQFFSQIVLHPGELAWLPEDGAVTTFSTLEDAKRAVKELYGRLPKPLMIYQVNTQLPRG